MKIGLRVDLSPEHKQRGVGSRVAIGWAMQKFNGTETVGASRCVGACCNLGHRPQFETIGAAMRLGTIARAPCLTLQPISLLTIRKHTLTVSNGLRTSFRRFG
jgi:hypothetical protein